MSPASRVLWRAASSTPLSLPMPSSQRKKPSVKQPLPVSDRIQRHFKSLVAQIDGGHLSNAIKTCDKILRLEPTDTDALGTKLALLLQNEQYAAALALSETLLDGEGHASFQGLFGKAYALYRLTREQEAADVVKIIEPEGDHEGRGVLHMEAQIEYRRGNYQKARALYSQIYDSSPPDSDEQSDSLINLTASQTHVNFLEAGFLRSLHMLPQTIINSLEDAPAPPLLSTHAVPVPTSSQPPSTEQEKKKVRMSRVPKGVVPGVTPPPDPERWIKKSERTVIHHGGRRKKTAGGGATQGSLVEGGSKSSGGKNKKKK
ncbi:hypothetical protein BU17DRAFT_74362 [Hysterangium stoloniferum]|nr:hypothetical protein BU17DRAFT_74362 [Hysterangium stoloniferum]